MDELVTGNYFDKYRSANPLHRWLMSRFLACARELIDIAAPRTVLEVGAGAGDLGYELFGQRERATADVEYLGTDISPVEIDKAQRQYPSLRFQVADICNLPFTDNSTDLVVACEVLEHLSEPAVALQEISRVARRHLLLSVPWEPTWRILNVLRGKYVGDWGNTPGHVQHFSRAGLRSLVAPFGKIVAERRPLPWTMLLVQADESVTEPQDADL